MLNDLELNFQYRSNSDSLYHDFYKPCLENSVKYDRAAGYFTSESLKVLAKGLDIFLHNKGKIRIVANPKLKPEDIEAIEKGYVAKESVLERVLLEEVEITQESIEDNTLNILSWLIYKDKLEFKLAYVSRNAIYHEKFGIFTDEQDNSVVFSGSVNETYSGISNNFEKIDVYFGKNDEHRIQHSIKDFENLWNNKTEELTVIDMPHSIREKILEYRADYPLYEVKEKSSIIREKPYEVREYQNQAISKWLENNAHGILEMATGTGKTITSLLACKRYRNKKGRLATVIIVPFQHLITQWIKDVEKITEGVIINCSGLKSTWLKDATHYVQNFNLDLIDDFVAITTYTTARSKEFKEVFGKLIGPSMLIADECHYITISGFQDFPFSSFEAKLGLSATPDRWWDTHGTQFIKTYVGNTIYEYTLEDAIAKEQLTPYEYYPHVVNLSEEELEEYKKLSKKAVAFLSRKNTEDEEKLAAIYRKRAKILSKAHSKISNFINDFKKEDLDKIKHTLVYCGEGQINELTKIIHDLDVTVSKFDSTVSNKDRKYLLKAFAEGEIQVLVAIKCLDEGVDVPATRKAYFLSSTSNPREFIQRRGRILRNHGGKLFAEIHDYIVLPENVGFDDFKSIATKELPRFAEFTEGALNSASAKNSMIRYLDYYNLTHLMYKKPWDVYKETKEMYDID